MSRLISPALQAKFNESVTSVFYLVQINCSQIIRWSNGGDVVVSGVSWSNMDFDIDGLSWSGGAIQSAHFKAQNMDNALGALFANEVMSDVTMDIYQVERNVLADPQHLGTMVMDDVTISPDFLTVPLISSQSANAKSPRRRIDVYNGFKHALPKGTKIVWGNEIFILEPFKS